MTYTFLVDTNLPIDTQACHRHSNVGTVLRDHDVRIEGTTDLPLIGRKVAAHEPDVALIPLADWHRSLRRGDDHYWGLERVMDL